MTRLTEDDLKRVPADLRDYDRRLKAVTGLGMLELALKTTGMTLEQYRYRSAALSWVAVIPITTGQGIIPGFAEKVSAIGSFLELPCRVTRRFDVAGLGEAVGGGSEIIVLGDDDAFLAVNLVSHRVVDNSPATGQIYAAALSAAAGGVTQRVVGILGLGPVGQAASDWLRAQGARLIVHDRDRRRQSAFLRQRAGVTGADSVAQVLTQSTLIIDATNSGGVIKASEIDNLILAAPGMPLGIDQPQSDKVRLIHDPFQLGVAAMLVQALS